MGYSTLALCVIAFLAAEITASSKPECPDTVPATGSNGAALVTCTNDSQCTVAGDKCCTVTTGGSGMVCIKAEHDNDDDDDCDKKRNHKGKEECHEKKRHKTIIKVIILVIAVVVVGVVVGCIIRVKCCKKKISDSTTDLNPEKKGSSLGRDYTPSSGMVSKEQGWFSVAPPTVISSAPPPYAEKY